MFPVSHVTIAGLGLIGGSLAYALRENTDCIVSGIDSDPHTLMDALERGAVHRAGGADMLEDAELLILALSPETADAFLREHIGRLPAGCIVTDVCGVKQVVVERLEPLCQAHGLRFIGGHPMAGKEKSGFSQADGALFRGASYILTPTAGTDDEALACLRALAEAVGCARLTITAPDEHDRMIAFTSQLPHVLAGAYVQSPRCPGHIGFSAGSYRDVSRVATVDENLWTELFMLNRSHLGEEIDTLIAHLAAYRDALAAGDAERLHTILKTGRECKQADLLREREAGLFSQPSPQEGDDSK